MTQLGRKKAKADAIDSNIFRSIFMQCEESRNHDPFLEHIGNNANLRNIVDQGLKLILFLSPENRIVHKLFWNITSHKLPESLERAFSLIQYLVFGSVYYQMLQRMQSCIFIFSVKMTCFAVMLVSNIFSNFSNPFKTCQTILGINASKTIPVGMVTLLNIACSEMAFLHSTLDSVWLFICPMD